MALGHCGHGTGPLWAWHWATAGERRYITGGISAAAAWKPARLHRYPTARPTTTASKPTRLGIPPALRLQESHARRRTRMQHTICHDGTHDKTAGGMRCAAHNARAQKDRTASNTCQLDSANSPRHASHAATHGATLLNRAEARVAMMSHRQRDAASHKRTNAKRSRRTGTPRRRAARSKASSSPQPRTRRVTPAAC
jgi:hypothetical protein